MQCSICNGTFSRKDSLKRHLLNVHGVQEEDDSVSTKEKTFACSQCDTKFTEKKSLNRHMKKKHDVVLRCFVVAVHRCVVVVVLLICAYALFDEQHHVCSSCGDSDSFFL